MKFLSFLSVTMVMVSSLLKSTMAWDDQWNWGNCPVDAITTNEESRFLSAGEIIYSVVTSASCNINYAYVWIYNERNWQTLCSNWAWYSQNTYPTTAASNVSISCQSPSGSLENGNYTYYVYWSNVDWSGGGSLYDYDKFQVVGGIDPDVTTPVVDSTLITPLMGEIDASSYNMTTLATHLKILDTGAGVSYISFSAYDMQWNYLCGGNFELDAGDIFDGVWQHECNIQVHPSMINGALQLSYFGCDKGSNCFSGSIQHDISIAGGMDPDWTSPVLGKVNLTSFEMYVGETLNVSISVSDPESGVAFVYCYAWNSWGAWWAELSLVEGDQRSGTYSVSHKLNTVGTFSAYCYASNNQWLWSFTDTFILRVYSSSSPTDFPVAQPSFAPTSLPTILPTGQSSSNTTTITVTITIEVSKSSGSRKLLAQNTLSSLKTSLQFVLYNSLQTYLHPANVTDIIMQNSQTASNPNGNDLEMFLLKANFTADSTSPEELFKYVKGKLETLDQSKLNHMSIFLEKYLSQKNSSSLLNGVVIKSAHLMSDRYTFFESSASPAAPPMDDCSSKGETLSPGSIAGISIASAFIAVCLSTSLTYLYLRKHPAALKEVMKESQMNPISNESGCKEAA